MRQLAPLFLHVSLLVSAPMARWVCGSSYRPRCSHPVLRLQPLDAGRAFRIYISQHWVSV